MSRLAAIVRSLLLAVFVYMIVAPAAFAIPERAVIVVISDYLTYSDVVHLPERTWEGSTSIGLMSVGLEAPLDPVANVYASLGAGDSIHAGDISVGRLYSALNGAHIRLALIGNADGDVIGEYRPLVNFAPNASFNYVADDEYTIHDPEAPGGVRTNVDRLWNVENVVGEAGVVVVHLGDMMRVERARRVGLISPAEYRAARRVAISRIPAEIGWLRRAIINNEVPGRLYFVVATPAGSWNHLCPVVIEDSERNSGGLLTSTTTRTPGLIASRDLAPSILQYLGVPIPIQMTGAPIEIRPMGDAQRDRTLDHLDRVTNFDQRAQSPFFWALGMLGGIVIFTCVGLAARGKKVGTPSVLYLLRVLSSWPLALLLVWLFDPHSMTAYLGWIGVLSFAIGLLPSPPMIFLLTSMVIVVDGFYGSKLVSQAVMSAYMMSGIRFYGIGNEYMGVLLGGALMAPVVFCRPLGLRSIPAAMSGRRVLVAHALLAAFLAVIVFVLSFPAFGAKAGGAVTATATFLFLFWELRGETVTWMKSVVAIAAGFILVFVWTAASRYLHLAPTHIGTAVGALQAGRFGYIIGVAGRKVGLAWRVATHPGTIVGALALLVLIFGARKLMRGQLQSLWDRAPVYRAVVVAGIRGCVVALLFNDSGVIAAILMMISLVLPVLYNIFEAGNVDPASRDNTAAAPARL